MPNIYDISVTWQTITPESAEQSEIAESGYEFRNKLVDVDELQHLISEYGFIEASCSEIQIPMWFSTPDPRKDHAFYEKAESTFLTLHLESVNDKPPTLEDYADIARMAKIRGLSNLDKIGTRLDA